MQITKDLFKDIRVLVIGDVMIDQYMFGEVFRNSPESPLIPVLENVKLESKLGGASNVACNIKLLGAQVELLTISGEDNNSLKLNALLNDNNIPTHIIADSSRPTTVKTRVFKGLEQLIRVDQESTQDISEEIANLLIKKLTKILQSKKIDILILQDYNKGIFTEYSIHEIIKVAHEYNLYISVDPKHNNFLAYKNVNLFKPNLNELLHQFENTKNISSTSKDEIENYSKKIIDIISCKTFLVTLSDKGAMILQDRESIYQQVNKIDIVDVCGAGDAVISVATLLDFLNFPPHEILNYSNKTGRIVCQKTGVAGISVEELINKNIF